MLDTLPTSAFSKEAIQVAQATDKTHWRFRNSQALGNSTAFENLAQIWEECKLPNWDGYGALSVSQDSLRNAYRLLESLPLGVPLPSIGAEPDGEITLEWHRGAHRTLSVSVTADESLHYSALIGPNIANGTIAFFGDFPFELGALVERVTG